MSKVFISYARDESCGQSLAIETQAQLEAAGIDVFRDVTGLKGGDNWLQKLEHELRASEVVVLVLSEKVLVSKWVPREVILAQDIGIPVIPISAERIEFTLLPLWVRHLQIVDFIEQKPWMKLYGTIVSKIGDKSLPNAKKIITTVSEHKVELAPPKIIEAPHVRTDSKHQPDNDDAIDTSWAAKAGEDQYGQYADLQVDDVAQRFRLIEPGNFWMGSPKSEAERLDNETRHRVTLTQAFWLADTTCTQALWKSVIGNNPAEFKDNDNNPVEMVSWDDAQEFLQTLDSMKLGVPFSLPTEAQWEYACRAGTNTPFSFGESITSEQVNYDGDNPYNTGKEGVYRGETVGVKSLPANKWGLYEMHGNVWEWCQDAFQEDLGREACTDPVHTSGAGRVIRGGSWSLDGRYARSACRVPLSPDLRDLNLGLRLSLVTSAKR